MSTKVKRFDHICSGTYSVRNRISEGFAATKQGLSDEQIWSLIIELAYGVLLFTLSQRKNCARLNSVEVLYSKIIVFMKTAAQLGLVGHMTTTTSSTIDRCHNGGLNPLGFILRT